LGFALGCGSKPEPSQAPAPAQTTPPTPPSPPAPAGDPNAGAPKAGPAAVAWEIDQAKQVIPAAPVRGSIAGAEATPEAVLEGDELSFRVMKAGTPIPERSVKVKLAPMRLPGQPLPQLTGRDWKVKFDAEPGPNVPEVWVDVAGKQPHLYPTGYALTLELGARKAGKVPGKVYLSLPDDQKTVLAGTFEATYVRPHTERPGPDDAPFIAGTVAVTGAKPDAQVRVAYTTAGPNGAVEPRELQLPFDPSPPELARWTRDEEARKAMLVAGDGKGRPFRYEFVKLTPGRYLVSAAVAGGPAVWKWLDVPAGGMLTENFTIDAATTGSVQVTVPAGVTGRVFLAPADDPAKPPMDANLFHAVALQTVRQEADIAGGKALVKDLGPGKYEVRVGDLRGFVDVTAGKTAELTLMSPKK
jgi:hypothetical protein